MRHLDDVEQASVGEHGLGVALHLLEGLGHQGGVPAVPVGLILTQEVVT